MITKYKSGIQNTNMNKEMKKITSHMLGITEATEWYWKVLERQKISRVLVLQGGREGSQSQTAIVFQNILEMETL